MPLLKERDIRIVEGESFFISTEIGDISEEPNHTQGFFYRDTRFLSGYSMTVNGGNLSLLSSSEVDYFYAIFYSTLPHKSIFASHPITLERHRFIGNGVGEEIIIHNYLRKAVKISLSILFDADFGDIMELREGKKPKGKRTVSTEGEGRIIFSYKVNGIKRKTIIQMGPGARIKGRKAGFEFRIPAKGRWTTSFSITPVWQDHVLEHKIRSRKDYAESKAHRSLKKWLERAPKLSSGSPNLTKLYKNSLVDLHALQIFLEFNKESVTAAGMPWFMTLFGRDDIITGYQSCMTSPDSAVRSLKSLSGLQGTKFDDFTEEEPGRIPHELRFGEETELGILPYSPYYGTADATPLFLILLNEVFRWTNDKHLANELKEQAIKALEWIEKYGDLDGDGYIEYKRKSPKGLYNQCWKDSGDSILFSDGTRAKAPIASVEIQGYAYDAKLRMAELAEEVWGDHGLANKLRNEAKELKRRFNQDFWIEERGGFFALALDNKKKKVDSITSNIGQLLWTGIVNEDKAEIIARQLMEARLFSGWGVRTMSDEDMGYNPIEYHNGTVWPHDNSLIAAGLARYGFRDEANRIIMALTEVSDFFENRLPEVFAGYRREKPGMPVVFPKSAFPQAWGAGSSLLFVRTMLGLEPDVQDGLKIDPHLPDEIHEIRLQNVFCRGEHFHIEAHGKQGKIELAH